MRVSVTMCLLKLPLLLWTAPVLCQPLTASSSHRPPSSVPDDNFSLTLPLDSSKFIRPGIFVLHLLSGRRRIEDARWHIEDIFALSSCDIDVLSLDIIHGVRGNLSSGTNVEFRRNRIQSDQVSVSGAGPPCVTWTTARYLPDGPPPLRSRDQPCAKAGLGFHFLQQLFLANQFCLCPSCLLWISCW